MCTGCSSMTGRRSSRRCRTWRLGCWWPYTRWTGGDIDGSARRGAGGLGRGAAGGGGAGGPRPHPRRPDAGVRLQLRGPDRGGSGARGTPGHARAGAPGRGGHPARLPGDGRARGPGGTGTPVTAQTVIGNGLVVAGTVLIVVAALGLFRLVDVYNRTNAVAKAAALGVSVVLVGVAV